MCRASLAETPVKNSCDGIIYRIPSRTLQRNCLQIVLDILTAYIIQIGCRNLIGQTIQFKSTVSEAVIPQLDGRSLNTIPKAKRIIKNNAV